MNIWSMWQKGFGILPLSWLFIFWEDWGERCFFPFDESERIWLLSDFTSESSLWKILWLLDKKSTYFIQFVSPYSMEMTTESLFMDVVIKWKMEYWWENDLENYGKYRWYDAPSIINWWKQLLFHKRLYDVNDDFCKIFFASYDISWWSSLSWMIVDFENKIICGFYDYWINIYSQEWGKVYNEIEELSKSH